ncbi:hypothetical protein SteCoe_33305 [Stentor coeruleus]|uniref:Tyrosine-protein kinase ephrin type A/B receptor-like domain-containing protein n=1 Tax=Stentor coeruleus TaxID=5963 RepID=A0A1R2AX10_9CILI|nr:hypothetical protein SteCoe_33305 [Stentor coeruleus]
MLEILFLLAVKGFEIFTIPSEGSSPSPKANCKSAFNPATNEIIIFGGQDTTTLEYLNSLYTFNIGTLVWREIIPQSYENPPGLILGEIFLVDSKKILLFFGKTADTISSEVYSFDLKTNRWAVENLTGDDIEGRMNYAFADYIYNNTRYLAIYGGLTLNGIDNGLFIIEFNTLNCRKMMNFGAVPNKGYDLSFVYYDKKLYLYGFDLTALVDLGNSMNMFDLDLGIWDLLNFTEYYPKPKLSHTAYAYYESMYIFFGLNVTNSSFASDIWSYNFSNNAWKSHGSFSSLIGYASAQIDHKIYLAFGYNNYKGQNSVNFFDLSQTKLELNEVVPNRKFPPKRKNHCSYKYNDSMYIFGGISENGEFLNDMWVFHNSTFEWESITSSNNVPVGRHSFGCGQGAGTNFIIYGGESLSGTLSDFYFYDMVSNTWVDYYISADSNPGKRAGHCICMHGYYTFIIGGYRDAEALKDVWLHNYSTESFEKFAELPSGLINLKCWTVLSEGAINIYVISGTDINYKGNTCIYKIILNEINGQFESEVLTITCDSTLDLSESAFIVSGNNALLISGSIWNRYLKSVLVSYNFITNQIISEYLSFSLFGHSALHMGEYIFVFGGGFAYNAIKVSELTSNSLYLIKSEPSGIQIGCSGGTIMIDNYCMPCGKGYYSSANDCLPCPKGTFSNKTAVDDEVSCLPCEYGYYSDKNGSLYCYECPSYSLCPIGSSELSSSYTSSIVKSYYQPKAFEGNTTMISNFVNKLWLYFALAVAIIGCAVFMNRTIFDNVEKVDLFISDHGQEINIPVVLRRTKLGGLFSIYFLLAASIIIIGSFMTFELDNVTEIKALIPLITIEETISAEKLYIQATFYAYGGSCNNERNDIFSFSETSIYFTSRQITLEPNSNNCIISITYNNIILSNSAKILMILTEKASRASYIGVNFTISSSIPSESSNAFIPIFPSNVKQVLIGTKPSIIPLSIIPSVIFIKVFYSQDNRWPSVLTGYHVASNDNVIIGETATQKTINSKSFVSVQLSFSLDNSALVTKRNINSSWFIFVGGVLGSIFGIMGSFSTVLGVCEGFADKYAENSEKREKVKRIKINRYIFDKNFMRYENYTKGTAKVVPGTFTDV